MQIKTDNGIAEPLPLSDIQEYNKILEKNTEAIKYSNKISNRWFIFACLLMITIALFIWYLAETDFIYFVIKTFKRL